jgi:myo-inositol-1(or 4)-monophosphatase
VSSYLEVCEEAVRRAGAVLVDRFGRVSARKKGPSDLVTEADFASQEVVRQTLHAAFPDHLLIGEEDAPSRRNSLPEAEFRWIVDPLDGTTNYVHRVPLFSVSLALEHRGRLLVGAVFNPISGECFTVAAEQGARLNGAPIRTSAVRTLSEALVAAGFPAVVTPDAPDFRVFNEVVLLSQAVRRTGSAALNLAYVAAGRFDAGWSCSTKIWDTAAGTLLIREAGGVATSFIGEDRRAVSGSFLVAATRELHGELLSIVRQVVGAVDLKLDYLEGV